MVCPHNKPVGDCKQCRNQGGGYPLITRLYLTAGRAMVAEFATLLRGA